MIPVIVKQLAEINIDCNVRSLLDCILDCSQPPIFQHKRKQKRAKRARSTRGWGEGAEQSESKEPNLTFCADIQFSCDSILAFNDGKKYEKLKGCEQFRVSTC